MYLDHNATTPVRPEVVEAMLPYFDERFGNASSLHGFGQENRGVLDTARGHVAALLGADAEEIVFTSGGTESDNLAIRGTIKARRRPGVAPHVVTCVIEHPAVLATCESIEKEGVEVSYIPCTSDGVVRLDLLERAIRPETVLVSIMLANNETGVMQPIQEVSRLVKPHGITLHTDAVQAIGKVPIDVNTLGVDLLSISAHKLYGPKGIGALYVRRGTPLEPVYTGGGHEYGLRPGTENIPGIVGFGESCRISKERLEEEMERISALRAMLEEGILKDPGDITVNGSGIARLPNTSNIIVSRVEGEAVTLNLSMFGFAVSSGSACSSGKSEPSHVLLAMGLSPTDAQGGIRISLGIDTTEEEIRSFLEVFPKVVGRLRELSPLKEHS
ncbi:MAG: cysteine desulfurase [bacterium]|nr:MAG: cysteine desulfurase [bacterium]